MRLPALILASLFVVAGVFGPGASVARAFGGDRDGKDFAIDVGGGLPRLIGLQLAYLGVSHFSFGIGFGSAPINGVLNAKVPLNAVPLNVSSSGDSYSLVPSATYKLYGTVPFVRYYPGDGGFFTQLYFSSWTFSGSFSAAVRDNTKGTSVSGLVDGSVDITMPTLGTMAGYEFLMGPGFYVDLGLGVSYLLGMSHTVSIGGTAADLAPVVGGGSADLDAAKAQVSSQVDSALASVEKSIRIQPAILMSMGWAF